MTAYTGTCSRTRVSANIRRCSLTPNRPSAHRSILVRRRPIRTPSKEGRYRRSCRSTLPSMASPLGRRPRAGERPPVAIPVCRPIRGPRRLPCRSRQEGCLRRPALLCDCGSESTRRRSGYASYMRIEPAHRVIEVGSILYTPCLQQTTAATEAMYLMASHVSKTWVTDATSGSAMRSTRRPAARRYGWDLHSKGSFAST